MFDKDKKTKFGFSLIEMMLLLLVLSLLTAASVPIVTKKHRKAPNKVFHGRFACFWNGNQLWQQQYSGENIIFNEPVSVCRFEAPRNANYFYIQLIGGGGGGGAAGVFNPASNSDLKINNYYSNTAQYYVSTYNYTSSTLDQFNLTEDEFNDMVSTKYVYLQVGSNDGRYCNQGNTWDSLYSYCEGTYETTGEFKCTSKTNSNTYYSQYTTQKACVDAGHKWVELMSTTACTNPQYGSGVRYAYSEPVQIKYGLHTSYFTTWSSSSSYYYTGSSLGYRNYKNAVIDGTGYPRAYGGYGYQKSFSYKGNTVGLVSASGGEGGEIGQCNGPANDKSTCTCATDYLTPADGEILAGSATQPTSSVVCTEGDSSCLYSVNGSSPAFFRRTYYQQQKMKYGIGGLAGEYKTFFARVIDPDIVISPGKGGAAGTANTNSTSANGRDGNPSQIGHMVARGGYGGRGNLITNYMRLPTKGDDEFRTNNGVKIQAGDDGAVSNFTYEANLLGIENPLSAINYADFGAGGDGEKTRNNCWEGYYKNVFVGGFNKTTRRNEDIPYETQYDWSDVNCKKSSSSYRWSGTSSQTYGTYAGYYRNSIVSESSAKAGYTGAIIISW